MSGPIPDDQKHVVVFEVPGPVPADRYDEFKKRLDQLVKDFKAQVMVHARSKKIGAGGPTAS